MNKSQNGFARFTVWLRQSLFVKLGAIGFLMLLLLIPNSLVQDTIRERQFRAKEAIASVHQSWSGPQIISGPVLTLPYSKLIETDNGKNVNESHTAHFLPKELKINGKINHQIRQKGIFDVVLFQSDIQIDGFFGKPNLEKLNIQEHQVDWSAATLTMGISSMTGVKKMISIKLNGVQVAMESGSIVPAIKSGVNAKVDIVSDTERLNFEIPLKLNGSEYFKIEPFSKTTNVTLVSDWPSPSFTGSFSPDSRTISKDGFEANWHVLDFNRSYPQQWKDSYKPTSFGFGVKLLQPVDEYAKNTRSTKYAFLVIGLTFMIYFFFETLKKYNIHPFQYLLIGLALSLFYLLLLSLSEHLGFNWAYLLASVATISLIVGYSHSFLKSRQLSIQLLLLLVLIYGFIFIILQLEDYALLAGSAGIFIALAATMFYSRKVDWYSLGSGEKE